MQITVCMNELGIPLHYKWSECRRRMNCFIQFMDINGYSLIDAIFHSVTPRLNLERRDDVKYCYLQRLRLKFLR